MEEKFKTFEISEISYNRDKRVLQITSTDKEVHDFPYETDWAVRLKPGMTLNVQRYSVEDVSYIHIYKDGSMVGSYGPKEKFKRDQFYGLEVNRKVAEL